MDDSHATCLIGVDGGGTSCRVALLHGRARHVVTLGPANAATDRSGAIRTVQRGIDQLVQEAGIAGDVLGRCRAHVALAGVMHAADAKAVAEGLNLQHVTVSDDRVAAVVGALQGDAGVDSGAVAGIGTGSFLARQSGGQMKFIGGWGLVLGDEASGAWLGRGLLSAVLQALDGLGPSSGLTHACLRRFGDAAGIVAFAGAADPGEFAGLAPEVAAAALTGDPVAQILMRRGADYIAGGLRQLGWRAGEPACLVGGAADAYAPWLPADLVASLRAPLGSALDGALQMAGAAAATRGQPA